MHRPLFGIAVADTNLVLTDFVVAEIWPPVMSAADPRGRHAWDHMDFARGEAPLSAHGCGKQRGSYHKICQNQTGEAECSFFTA